MFLDIVGHVGIVVDSTACIYLCRAYMLYADIDTVPFNSTFIMFCVSNSYYMLPCKHYNWHAVDTQ